MNFGSLRRNTIRYTLRVEAGQSDTHSRSHSHSRALSRETLGDNSPKRGSKGSRQTVAVAMALVEVQMDAAKMADDEDGHQAGQGIGKENG